MSDTSPSADAGAQQFTTLRALGYWSVVGGWMLVISQLSGEPFSAANTNRYLDPVLRYFFPRLTPAGFVFAHTLIRKAAHFCEFFVLGGLSYWAARRGRPPAWQSSCALQAAALSALWALADEGHQAFVRNRTASFFDSAVDAAGALSALAVLYVWKLARRRRTPE